MTIKWIGAALIICGCGTFGLSLAASYRQEQHMLRQLIHGINYMECELQYRLTPLPQLCRQIGSDTRGSIRILFIRLAEELERQLSPDVRSCMNSILSEQQGLPSSIHSLMRELGSCLGRFDLPGQLQELDLVRSSCRKQLEKLEKDADIRLRNYQTLGLCTGAALAILFI